MYASSRHSVGDLVWYHGSLDHHHGLYRVVRKRYSETFAMWRYDLSEVVNPGLDGEDAAGENLYGARETSITPFTEHVAKPDRGAGWYRLTANDKAASYWTHDPGDTHVKLRVKSSEVELIRG